MGISETLWDGSCNGNVKVDGCNLYGNDSKGRRGGGQPNRPGVTRFDNVKGNDGIFGVNICQKANGERKR